MIDDVKTAPGHSGAVSPVRDPTPRPAASRGELLRRAWPSAAPRWSVFGSPPSTWWPDVLLLTGLLVISAFLLWPSALILLDVEIRDLGQQHQEPIPYWLARGLNYLGQGSPLAVLCLGLSSWAAWTYRTVRPLVLFVTVYIAMGAVLLLKFGLDRPAPRYPDPLDPPYVDAVGAVLFSGAGSASYPSGHAVNAIVWYGLMVLLLGSVMTWRRRHLLMVVPPVLVVASQTYLGYHWLSDAPAGVLLGTLLLRCVRRVPWDSIPMGLPAHWDRNCRGTAPLACVMSRCQCAVRARRRASRARRKRLISNGSASKAAG